MFILVQPMYSKQELNADSNYVVYTQLISALTRLRPAWQFLVVFPDRHSGFDYTPDGFFDLPGVMRLPQRISPRKTSNAVTYEAEWYDALFRRIGIDLVWCNLVEIAASIRKAGEATFERKANAVVVAAHNYVIHPTLPYPFEEEKHIALMQLVGALCADWNVFNSDYCQWMLLDNARRFLNAATQQAILDKSSRINYGALEADWPKPTPPRNRVPIIAYNHRLQGYKNYQDTFALLNELYEEGVPFTVRYMNNSPDNITKISRYPFVEIKLCATRRDYLEQLRGCDLNVINSQHETFCIAAVESMAFGQPLIAPDALTFPEITGRAETGYPYLFKSRAEQKAMLKHLLTTPADRRRWGRVASDFVRREFNNHLWAERYAALFEQLTQFNLNVSADARAMVAAHLRQHSGDTSLELKNRIIHTKVNGRHALSNQSLTLTKLVRLARECGAQARMEGNEQRIYWTGAS